VPLFSRNFVRGGRTETSWTNQTPAKIPARNYRERQLPGVAGLASGRTSGGVRPHRPHPKRRAQSHSDTLRQPHLSAKQSSPVTFPWTVEGLVDLELS